ncbi:HNH endonuclease [Luteimonas sp. S4-F44]|uniref:HNH endonuclease signature motif containing protein n=1 Tax=Luteimonas sp. S4-F44 TaxID=2925842 RepID=UPI001F538B7C|nr:HNH endonuclease signature motif containing protein [Luteimonas sp. S4-F44]UNK43580.1 HNH endonuclease [Luteimonas sp. S4-F44]
MTQRTKKFRTAADLLGPLVIGNADPGNGWPGSLIIQTQAGNVNVALHVSSVSSHARKPYEKRFQNPASEPRPAVSDLNGTATPILLGLDHSAQPSVFVAIDGGTRLGRTTRFSILFHERILAEARANGWAVYESNTGEKIYAFLPALFPAFIEQVRAGEMLSVVQMVEAASASGAADTPQDQPAAMAAAAARATKAVKILVRKAGAGRKIRSAYAYTCAMCGIGSNLLEGAHIFPVEAPGSTDEVWNGLSLCHNHHGAFDQHLIWVDPATKAIRLHPSLLEEARTNVGTRHFVESTRERLEPPTQPTHRPRREMFENRYAHYEGKYAWAE